MALAMKNALKALAAYEQRGSKSLTDRKLENRLFSRLTALEKLIDEVAPTPLRYKLSELVVQMRAEIWIFDQSKSPWR